MSIWKLIINNIVHGSLLKISVKEFKELKKEEEEVVLNWFIDLKSYYSDIESCFGNVQTYY